jgi:serine/threonine protein kinase
LYFIKNKNNMAARLEATPIKDYIEETHDHDEVPLDRLCEFPFEVLNVEQISKGSCSTIHRYRVKIVEDGRHDSITYLVLKKLKKINPVDVSRGEIVTSFLDHPGIIKYQYFIKQDEGGHLSITEPKLDGWVPTDKLYGVFMPYYQSDVTNHIKTCYCSRTTISFEEVGSYFAQMVSALVYLHTMGFWHRDIKGRNFLLSRSGDIVLADFGFCSKKETLDGSGTFSTMAPEVLFHRTYFEESDYWSLGCVLFRMIFKRQLHYAAKTETDLLALMKQFCEKRIEDEDAPYMRFLACDKTDRGRYPQDGDLYNILTPDLIPLDVEPRFKEYLFNVLKGLLQPEHGKRLNGGALLESHLVRLFTSVEGDTREA